VVLELVPWLLQVVQDCWVGRFWKALSMEEMTEVTTGVTKTMMVAMVAMVAIGRVWAFICCQM